MNEAPERIWAVHWNTDGAVLNGAWADTIRHFGGGVEYVRASDYDALAAKLAEVGAERDRWSFRADAYIIRAEAAEMKANKLSDKLELERALTDGAHRRAEAAETALNAARAALVTALEHLDRSLFTNAEHQRAKDTLRAAIKAQP